jgi:DNA-binding transcriptional ArsR family regulator
MSQHLAALRRAGLIQQERRGRFVHYGVDPQGLTIVAGWLARYRAHWPAQIKALQSLLKDVNR